MYLHLRKNSPNVGKSTIHGLWVYDWVDFIPQETAFSMVTVYLGTSPRLPLNAVMVDGRAGAGEWPLLWPCWPCVTKDPE